MSRTHWRIVLEQKEWLTTLQELNFINFCLLPQATAVFVPPLNWHYEQQFLNQPVILPLRPPAAEEEGDTR